MLLLNMSRVQRAVVLELRKYFKDDQRIQRHTENTLHRRKIEMVNAPLLVQQFTHPVHPNSSYRLSYLLRQFVDKTGKIRNRQQTKYTRKKQARQYTGVIFSFQKSNCITMTCPCQTAYFGRLTTRLSLAAGQLVISQTPRERRLVV